MQGYIWRRDRSFMQGAIVNQSASTVKSMLILAIERARVIQRRGEGATTINILFLLASLRRPAGRLTVRFQVTRNEKKLSP